MVITREALELAEFVQHYVHIRVTPTSQKTGPALPRYFMIQVGGSFLSREIVILLAGFGNHINGGRAQ